ENRDSKLIAQAAKAERIVIGVPEKGGVAAGIPIDIPPGGQFLVQVDRAVTGRRSALVMVVNGGDEKQHPRYIAGRQYVFLLKRNADGKKWDNLATSEIPVKDGKVQYVVGGKVEEELALGEFEELAARDAPAIAET